MASSEPPICDTSAIALPTDAITLGVMRRREPEIFSLRSVAKNMPAHCDAVSTLSFELRLAEKAFAVAAGLPDPHPVVSRSMALPLLNEAYVEYGLSSGMAQTRELVRQFEAAAAAQAKHGGRPRR